MGLYKLFKRMPIPLLVYMNVIVLSAVVAMVGYVVLDCPLLVAQAVSWVGLIAAMLGIVLYVVVIDSKKRWPGMSVSTRFSRFITFSK